MHFYRKSCEGNNPRLHGVEALAMLAKYLDVARRRIARGGRRRCSETVISDLLLSVSFERDGANNQQLQYPSRGQQFGADRRHLSSGGKTEEAGIE